MSARRLVFFIFILIYFIGVVSRPLFAASDNKIYVFYGKGCPHCTAVLTYLEEHDLIDRYNVEVREIYFNRENALLYNRLLDDLGVPKDGRGVPTLVAGDAVIVGDQPIIDRLEEVADAFVGQSGEQAGEAEIDQDRIAESTVNAEEHFDDEGSQGLDLTIAAVVAGSLVDAINPCAFAVLIILMTTILVGGSPRKALRAGLAFSSSVFLSYFLMGLGLYSALSVGGFGAVLFRIVGWLAVLLGLFNLKDYFWYGKGFLMEVPLSWRPRLKGLLQSVSSPVGAFGIGFLVSLFLLPCTSGPYIVILGMLAKQSLQAQGILYLILYNLIFVSPMILISYLVYRGFDPKKAEAMRQKQLRTLHLIAGILLLGMGLVILQGWV